ncbi:DUF664 domain-containing protein [Cellulophaga sp. HaHaR_3_176]|uniref:DinB family protein n=1 Tax=Cellulophaga sp. HaHaR_3_176 TaxID=1942464 RepID=UPI001C1F4A68|nr:DUF664 domain-containing protein [Cellulophaga sp. HaHaR_3_176]QWX82964.1 DUF664 domain-containing protein [Cellulophaga sp. HaHaR_3_176]
MIYKYVIALVTLFSFSVNAQNVKEVSGDWTSFSQFLEISSNKQKKFKVVAHVKVDTGDDNAWAGVWARVDDEGGEQGFFDNMGDRPIKSNVWKSYTVEGLINENSETLNFGGVCVSNGKFYFDKFELYIEDDNGVLQQIKINNSSFENVVSYSGIPKWSQGVSKENIVKIKEYEISSSTDAAHGKKSLLYVGAGIEPPVPETIGGVEGASPQIGAMISMLEDLKNRVEYTVKDMSIYELDHLHDEKANRIGALIMHLAAAEKYYQVFTFEGRDFNEEEKKIWGKALILSTASQEKYKGHDAQYYLDIYNEVREKTIEELKKRDDKWFEEVQPSYGWTNHYCWFHVMEHQSSHLGQILFLAKRIPPKPEINLTPIIKN